MKRKILMAAALVTIALHGCQKEPMDLVRNDTPTARPAGNTDKTIIELANGNVNGAKQIVNVVPTGTGVNVMPGIGYQLLTLPQQQNQAVIWNSGYLAVNGIALNTYEQMGNALFRQHFETNAGQGVKLFSPTNLGAIHANAGSFYSIEMSLLLAPSGNSAALSLDGTLTTRNAANGVVRIPVQLIVNETATMPGLWEHDITLAKGGNYNATLYLNLTRITAGITEAMLADAEKPNGVIVISANQNRNLYQQVIMNLQTSLEAVVR